MTQPAKEEESGAEELFSRATQDVSAFLWACSRFSDPPRGYAPQDLLLMALSSRARGRLAISLVREAGPDFNEYGEKLSRIFAAAEEELSRLRRELGPSFKTIAIEALEREARILSGNLAAVSETGAEADLFGATPESFAGFSENAHLFVLGFSDLSRARTELSSMEGTEEEGPANALEDLTQAFSERFGFFAPVREFMENARAREYGDDPWWLTRVPDPADVPDAGLSNTELEPYAEAFRLEAETAPRDCPRALSAIAVALSEADPELRKSVMAHAASCRYCRRLILDLGPSESPGEDVAAPNDLSGMISEMIEERFPSKDGPRTSRLRRAAGIAALLFAAVLLVLMGTYAARKAEQEPAPAISVDPLSRLPLSRLIAPLAPGPRTGKIAVTGRRHRGMYLGGAVTGFSVFPVRENGKLKSGDEFRIHVTVKPEAYVYLFFLDSSGKISALLSAKLPAGQTLSVPDHDAWFSLDNRPGTETVWLLANNRPLLRFEARLALLEALGAGAIDKIFPESSKASFSFDHEP